MHGLGVYGAVAVAACRAVGVSATSMQRLRCRFAGIVRQGETLDLRIWRIADSHAFTASCGERPVLDFALLETA